MERRPRTVRIRLTRAQYDALEDAGRPWRDSAEEVATDWIVERLGRLPEVFEVPPWPSKEDVRERRQQLRARYQPADVHMLLVSETRREEHRSFYAADSDLFEATRAACKLVYGPLPQGAGFLRWFQAQQFWSWTVPPRPRGGPRGRPRKDHVDGPTLRLARLLRDVDPELMVVVGAQVEVTARRAAELASYRMHDVRVFPYPRRQWRSQYIDELSRFMRVSFPPGSAAPADMERTEMQSTLHDAMLRVLEKEERPLSSRELANEIAYRGLYRRRDGRQAQASQVSARARRYPALFEVAATGIKPR